MRSKRLTGRTVVYGLLLVIPVAFFALFFFYPLASILWLGLAPDGVPDVVGWLQLTVSPYFRNVLWFTIWQAALSTLLTLLLAFPGAYVLARYRFRGKSLVRAIATVPFVLPTVVVATAFTALIGPRGLINSWLQDLLGLSSGPIQLSQTVWLILIAHVFYNYSIALRLISTYWQNLSPALPEAAQMLGASRRQAFRHITLPALRPALLSSAALVFIYCFTSFGVILILGGPRFATIEVEIYRQALNLFNLPVAAGLSLWQIIFTFILMWFYTRLQASSSRPTRIGRREAIERPIQTLTDRILVYGVVGAMMLFIGAPLVALASRSLRGPDGLSLIYYRELFNRTGDSLFFVPPMEAVFNSLSFALVAMTLAVILGLLSAQMLFNWERPSGRNGDVRTVAARVLDPLLMLPLATSAVTLGLGYIIALDKPPLNLRSSIILVPIAHALVAIPFVLRSVLPALRNIRPSWHEAATTLGAGDWQVWREITWPLLRSAILVGAVFAFTISMGEFGATVFIARPQTPTMPVAIFRFLGQPGGAELWAGGCHEYPAYAGLRGRIYPAGY
ncbi:MAG: iron ABC transporter permease [Chloroflexota bacterium]